MKILMYTLALMSAFFVFKSHADTEVPEGYPSNYIYPPIPAETEKIYVLECKVGSTTHSLENPDVSTLKSQCMSLAKPISSSDGCSYTPKNEILNPFVQGNISFRSKKSNDDAVCKGHQQIYYKWRSSKTGPESCPPKDNPDFDNPIIWPAGSEILNCAKLKDLTEPEPEPDDKCDEFGNNSMLPPKSGVGQVGQTACYTNPATGLQCQYKQGGDNFIATGKTCDGDENDYGDKPTPEPPKDGGDDNCYNYGSQGQVLICDVDPNEGCNPLLINGETQYQCPAGCGSMDGVYFCTYDDIDGDGVPDDKNQNGVPDNEETCVNGRCTPNTPTDGTGGETPTPTPETPDMTETNNRLDAIKGELGFIGGKIDTSNKKLDGINSGIQGLKGEQKASNSLLGSISNSNEQIRKNTGFTADNTGELLDSFNEFKEGFGETDIEGTFDPSGSASFYESEYEEGFEGVWNEKSLEFKQTETFNFLQQFAFNSGGSPPDTQMCFNLGSHMDFGCAELPTPSPQLLAILKVFILITAAFLCRALIFGG
tara:strand:+ start:1210 stop:2826 length:1617 start_codon:yes stop_codon:yes gene_type:complete